MKGSVIVSTFRAEHGLDANLLGRSLDPRVVALRAELIRRLRDAKLNNSEIARVVNVDITTVRYWLSDDVRADKIRARREADRKHKLSRWWDECAEAMANA
jgi:predicted transcriptional regulator